MIVTLLSLIEENTDSIYEDIVHFQEYLVNKGVFNRLSFHQALEELELYCLEEGIEIGDHMPSIR